MKQTLWFKIAVSALIIAGIAAIYVARDHAKRERTNEVLDAESEYVDPPLYDGFGDVVPESDAEIDDSVPATNPENGEIVPPSNEYGPSILSAVF